MKKRNEGWFPRSRPKQRVMFLNVRDKINNHAAALPLAQAKVDRLFIICNTFLAVFDYIEQARATAEGLTQWQNLIFEGAEGQMGDPATAPPPFQPLFLPAGAFIGIFEEFKDLVEDIKSADGYTEAIGEDLMIVGDEGEEIVEADLVAELEKVQPMLGYKINLDGTLQGMSAMRVEYWAKGATIPQVDKFTKFPAVMTVYPKTPGEPETGHLRAFLLKDNEQVGLPSPDYPVTLS